MQILLANPRGFCAGVERAIGVVEAALARFGAPVYVRHEVVHNRFVCDRLRREGAVFVEDISEAPAGSLVIFSAHGVSKAVRRQAEAGSWRLLDATCPLVTKVHLEVAKMQKAGRKVVMIGHKGHPEVEGTMGQAEEGGMLLVEKPADAATLVVESPEKLAFVTQTTLSQDDAAAVVDALRARFPEIAAPKKDDICYATQNRQNAVKRLAARCGLVLVVGSPNSSNSRRLKEVAESQGVAAHLIDSAREIQPGWLQGQDCIGVSAGASAPEDLVEAVVARLCELGGTQDVQELGGEAEDMHFSLPKELQG
jgi:4-hydroxy-3-methylbut-2-enyl diphosphate reductase